MLMTVTLAHRALALRQSIVLLVISTLTVSALYIVAVGDGRPEVEVVRLWAAWTAVNIALRASLTVLVFRARSPANLLRSLPLRLVPLAIAALAIFQWIWTIGIFVGVSTPVTFIAFAGLLATSVAAMSMWATAPLAPVAFVAITWASLFLRLADFSVLPPVALAATLAIVALLLWTCTYLQVKQVREILNRSDGELLLLEGLRTMNAELQAATRR
jgi:hypothetical protein